MARYLERQRTSIQVMRSLDADWYWLRPYASGQVFTHPEVRPMVKQALRRINWAAGWLARSKQSG